MSLDKSSQEIRSKFMVKVTTKDIQVNYHKYERKLFSYENPGVIGIIQSIAHAQDKPPHPIRKNRSIS